MTGIYKITNPNGKIYIGQSIDIESRWNHHTNERVMNTLDWPLYRSLRKYGVDKHNFMVVEECDVEELNERERYYQEKYNTVSEGLNCKLVGFDEVSGVLNDKIKSKISETLTGYTMKDERRQKVRDGVVRYMSNLTIEQRKEIYGKSSRKRMGKPGTKWTDERKKQASIDRKGKLPPNCKSVCIDGVTYVSINEAVRQTDYSEYTIRKHYIK